MHTTSPSPTDEGSSRVALRFFFKQKTAYEIIGVTGVQTCALPILQSIIPAPVDSRSALTSFAEISAMFQPFLKTRSSETDARGRRAHRPWRRPSLHRLS